MNEMIDEFERMNQVPILRIDETLPDIRGFSVREKRKIDLVIKRLRLQVGMSEFQDSAFPVSRSALKI